MLEVQEEAVLLQGVPEEPLEQAQGGLQGLGQPWWSVEGHYDSEHGCLQEPSITPLRSIHHRLFKVPFSILFGQSR